MTNSKLSEFHNKKRSKLLWMYKRGEHAILQLSRQSKTISYHDRTVISPYSSLQTIHFRAKNFKNHTWGGSHHRQIIKFICNGHHLWLMGQRTFDFLNARTRNRFQTEQEQTKKLNLFPSWWILRMENYAKPK